MLKHLLAFLLILFFSTINNFGSTDIEQTVLEKEMYRRIQAYIDHVYHHNLSYMKNRGYSGHITKMEARNLVESSYVLSMSNDFLSFEEILAQKQRESHYYLRAWNRFGARGPAQIVHRLWRKDKGYSQIIKSENDLFLPLKSVRAQIYIMHWFYKRTNEKESAFQRYSGNAKNYYSDIQKIKEQLLSL